MKAALSAVRRERMRARALECFGLEIGKAARRELLRKMQDGEVKFSRKLTHSRTVVVSEYGGLEVTFIYSRNGNCILSFLPPDAWETAPWRASVLSAPLEPRSMDC